MTGDQLIVGLGVGDFLRIAHQKGKVHRAYIYQNTGDMRICRPSMLEKARGGIPREWVQVNARKHREARCNQCE